MERKIGVVCFGEVITPIERLQMKHAEGLESCILNKSYRRILLYKEPEVPIFYGGE